MTPGLALFTDLYELTMLQAYSAAGLRDRAVFSLFVRRLPEQRNFLLACGLDAALACIEQLRFSEEDLEYLQSVGRFSMEFLDALRAFRFTGDVYAVPEGTPVFADEPILEVVAPLPEAQLVETVVMNQIHVQTVLASKAARVVAAARGRQVVDFGARRAHGVDAAVQGARAFYIAGVHATSNVLAGRRHGIPVAGTMAHSFVQAHDEEREAFRVFAETFPNSVLLVDTYDTLNGVRRVIDLVTSGRGQYAVGAVRLDSGDLATLAREARRLFDAAGLRDMRIFASSGLDEYQIHALLDAGAPIDGFGIGSALAVSDDAPVLDVVYKLCEYAGRGRTKLSAHKPVLPGRKQVFRVDGADGGDAIGRADEQLEGRPLLRCVMRDGKRTRDGHDTLAAARSRAAREIGLLPAAVTGLGPAVPPYRIVVSPRLQQHHDHVQRHLRAAHT